MLADAEGSSDQQNLWRRPCEYLLIALLASAMILGGAPNAANWQILLLCGLAAALLPVAMAAGAADRFAQLPVLARICASGVVLIPLAQLIPLPPQLWNTLPGRELAGETLELIGSENQWYALSLVPRITLFAFLMLLPPAAAFLAALCLDRSGRRRVVWALIIFVAVSILVGFIQFGSKGTSLDLYNTAHRGSFLGFFANRNHQGLLMAVGGAFAIAAIKQRIRHPRIAMATSALVAMIVSIASLGTLSRAGIGLTALSVIATFYACFLHGRVRWPILLGGAVAGATGLYLITFSSTFQAAMDRYSQVQENERWQIWESSWPLVEQFKWAGAGVGSFTTTYPTIEKLSDVFELFYNRAHNDYLELLIESGLPGLLVLAVFLLQFVRHALTAWRGEVELGSFAIPSAIAIVLVGLHSLVDYPLRTQSHAVIFALACSFFFAQARSALRDGTQVANWSSKSVRFKSVSITTQASILIAFVLFVNYQQASAGAEDRTGAGLVNAEGEAMNLDQLAAAKRALARQPLDQSLLNAIYASEVRSGLDESQRRAYVSTLGKLGWRDTETQQNLLFEAARRNDLKDALDHMDALLRRRKLEEQIIPLLAQLEIDPVGMKLMAERLAQQPVWRMRYFSFGEPLSNPAILDARLRLFAYMREHDMPVDRLELRATLYALLRAGRRGDIVTIARGHLNREHANALMFDSDFDQLKPVPTDQRGADLPYEWRLTNRAGVSAQIVTDDWSGRLVLRWNGRGAPIIARTMTFLTEGQQPELEVSLSAGSQLRGLDSLRFTLICPSKREDLFVRKAAGTAASPGMDRRSAYYEAESGAPCDYPELFIGGRPKMGDRGADLSIDSIKLTLP